MKYSWISLQLDSRRAWASICSAHRFGAMVVGHAHPRIVEAITSRQRFVLSSHSRPDGDSIGSQLAMAYALEALGKEVAGEGLIGLTRGFMYAGVPRVEHAMDAVMMLTAAASEVEKMCWRSTAVRACMRARWANGPPGSIRITRSQASTASP